MLVVTLFLRLLKSPILKYCFYILAFIMFFSCKRSSSSLSKEILRDTTAFRKLSEAEKSAYRVSVQRMYDSLLLKTNFNGAIIVAKNGEILLEEYIGYNDFNTKDTITPATPFHIASISKTFTGMAVLKLWEENKLLLTDSIQKFFPEFPYHGVTVSMLLSHRTGLPNYVYFIPQDTAWKKRGRIATNKDVLDYLIKYMPLGNGLPGRNFHYCNTNFALLALIVEKVTGQSFPGYMRNNLFIPLGMKNTFVFSIADTASYHPSYLYPAKPIGLENIDCIYGDKNVYSTVRDLLLWDRALYSNTFVSRKTFEEAIKPNSLERPSIQNYGLGWRLMMFPGNQIVYHNGWWHGNNAVFARVIKDTATVIITGNRYNKSIYRGIHIADVFNDSLFTSTKDDE